MVSASADQKMYQKHETDPEPKTEQKPEPETQIKTLTLVAHRTLPQINFVSSVKLP